MHGQQNIKIYQLMFRPLLLWPSSGWIQFFLSEKLYRYDMIWYRNKLLV